MDGRPGAAALDELFTSVVKSEVEADSDDDYEDPVEMLLPFLKSYGMLNRTVTAKEVGLSDLKELAGRWGVKTKDPRTLKDMKQDALVQSLIDFADSKSKIANQGIAVPNAATLLATRALQLEERHQTKSTKKGFGLDMLSQSVDQIRVPKKKKKLKNFFGLPAFAYNQNSTALVYYSRKSDPDLLDENAGKSALLEKIKVRREQERLALLASQESATQASARVAEDAAKNSKGTEGSKNVAAQRKVAEALVAMSRNETMVKHFMHKGGADAVIKLIAESADKQVLTNCVNCLIEVTTKGEFCKVLTDKYILTSLQQVVEKGDYDLRLAVVQVLANLTYQESQRSMLVLAGAMPLVQLVMALVDQHDCISFCMVVISNVASVLELLPDLEMAVKICMTCTKLLDIKDNYVNALLAVEVFVNFTRCYQYSTLLCEEGVLPLFMSMLELHLTAEMIGKVAEGMVNLSTTRKNRREIANCGIALFLDKIFILGLPDHRANILGMIGNLLTSGFFHDKIAREETINTMLHNMLDPQQKKQFISVSFCVAQMAQVETSANVMVKCGLIKIMLDLIPNAPEAAVENMWTVLVALSQQPKFFESLVAERSLILESYKEISSEGGSKFTDLILQLAFNLSLRTDLVNYLSPDLVTMYVDMLKTVFSTCGPAMRATALNTIVNFCTYAPDSRKGLLGFDLISVLEEVGIEDPVMNVRYAAVLNILSMQENLCIKLLDGGAQKLLVSMQGSITTMASFVAQVEKKKRRHTLSAIGASSSAAPVPTIIDSELGKAITAATLHNLSLKRPVMGPGVLLTFMSLLRNCKTSRILHVARALANVSTHPRAKLALAKERRLIPMLTSTMRGGCEEADRVQHYCSLTICNVLAVQIDKTIMEELCKTGAITDLVVCTLLRINSVFTKESLTKALFNLLARADFRQEMACKLDVLGAMLELAKIENVELLELSIRSVYNITCETNTYAAKLGELKVPNVLVARITSSPNIAGAKATTAIKFLCAMSLANMSFHPALAQDMLFDKGLPSAAFAMFQLNSDEATYCTSVMLSNLCQYPEVKNLADSCVIPLLVQIMQRGPASSTQMAVSVLTSYSQQVVFFDQLVKEAIRAMIDTMQQPAMHAGIKQMALQFVYNLCTLHEPACNAASMNEVAASLWKMCKGISNAEGNEATLLRIGRITKEICASATTAEVQKKLLSDGIMSIILKLSKIEIPSLKFDLSFAIYSLSQGYESLKVLQWEGVDVLFWLTLHDCLGLYDPIRKNVSRALRNFSSVGDRGAGAILLAKEERTMTILRCLARSTNEDVQWQAAGGVYNILSITEAQPDMLSRGVIQLLLDLAGGGYEAVRHVCSACLHLCPPENMPDLSDPAALQLVLCLLEVEGDKFAQLGELSNDNIQYTLGNLNKGTDFVADPTPFAASWVCIACDVDTIFSVRVPRISPCSPLPSPPSLPLRHPFYSLPSSPFLLFPIAARSHPFPCWKLQGAPAAEAKLVAERPVSPARFTQRQRVQLLWRARQE
jgi:hypothetical protein